MKKVAFEPLIRKPIPSTLQKSNVKQNKYIQPHKVKNNLDAAGTIIQMGTNRSNINRNPTVK